MISWLLEQRLRPAVIRHRRVALLWRLAAAWGIIALVALGLVAFRPFTGLAAMLAAAVLALATVGVSLALWLRHQRRPVNLSEVARALEARFPDLRGLLLTAVQLPAGDLADTNFLQRRVLRDAVAHAGRHDWTDLVPPARRWSARAAVTGGLVALVVSLGLLATLPAGARRPGLIALGLPGVEVTPGDVSLEKGQSLVVLARFGGTPPTGAELVLAGPEGEQRLTLVRSLSDPVFGGSVAEVATHFTYRVEYAGRRTRDFSVTVFEHPRLERADVDLTFPAYTGRAPRRIEDTRRITAVEGTEAALALRLNKPVAAASLVPRGTNLPALTLATASNAPAATINPLRLTASASYELRLVDADGRTNRLPATFVVEALPNRAPELRLTSPRGDVRPSPLEEISFTGSVWDDFGVTRYGLAWTRVGGGTEVIELGAGAGAEERRAFEHTLRLEDLGVAPDDLLAWHLWAEDIGPDGQPRRTEGDLFFAEVRPFDEIFRESEGGGGEEMAGGEGGGGGGRPGRLTELQKQIINATWRLHRQQGGGGAPEAPVPAAPPARGSSRHVPRPGPAAGLAQVMGQRPAPELERVPGSRSAGRTARQPATVPPPTGRYEDDLAVVSAAAQQALDQAREAMQRQQDPRTLATWAEAIRHLETSLAQLERAGRTPAALAEALVTQQAAYQALLKLQARETAVTRGQQRGQGGGGENSMTQRQIDQLDLRQSENRYETRRQARSPQDELRREELALQNRLQELARRQEDVNQRLQELQTALQEARSEREREELRRELKRLQEEQQQMLADLDEMQQRMSRPENQSRLAEQRQQLEQAREDLQRAAEAAGQGQVSQALASGARAQQQLQELRDQMRRQSSSQFAEELRELRAEARELARRQEAISRQLAGGPAEQPQRRSLGEPPAEEQAVEQLAQQAQRLTNLVARATQLSQEAEASEPLVTRQLYDALRQFSQDDAGAVKETREELLRRGRLTREFNDRLQAMAEGDGARAVDLTAELLRRGLEPQARDAAQRARAGVETLRSGVERAADSVLGDDTEALRLAEASLEELAAAVERELAASAGATNAPATGGGRPGDPSRPADSSAPSDPSRAGAAPGSGQPQDAGEPRLADRGDSPGEGQPGGSPQDGDGGRQEGPGGRQPPSPETAAAGGRQGGAPRGGGGPGEGRQRDAFNLAELFNEEGSRGGGTGGGPITGEDFAPWADRLRDVEDMVDDPEWRTRLTGAREQARVMRLEQRRDQKKPDWAVVQLEVLRPLVEVRDALRQELARRSADTGLAPLDRDPVPDRYSDLVRRYYEELGRAN